MSRIVLLAILLAGCAGPAAGPWHWQWDVKDSSWRLYKGEVPYGRARMHADGTWAEWGCPNGQLIGGAAKITDAQRAVEASCNATNVEGSVP